MTSVSSVGKINGEAKESNNLTYVQEDNIRATVKSDNTDLIEQHGGENVMCWANTYLH